MQDLSYSVNSIAESLQKNSRKKSDPENKDQPKDRKVLSKPRILIILIIILTTTIATIIGVLFVPKEREKDPINNISTVSTEKTTLVIPTEPVTSSSDTSLSSSSTSTRSVTTESISTTIAPVPFKIITRSDWGSRPMKGRIKLKSPVKRLIIMDTQTEKCYNTEACKTLIKDRQLVHYNDYEQGRISIQDIRENFLISSDGTIFEGRGFSYEGQHSYDQSKTSYNSEAIGISFIGNYSEQDIDSRQNESLKYFIQKCIEENNLILEYKLYYKYQLTESRQTYDKLYETVKMMNHWKESENKFDF